MLLELAHGREADFGNVLFAGLEAVGLDPDRAAVGGDIVGAGGDRQADQQDKVTHDLLGRCGRVSRGDGQQREGPLLAGQDLVVQLTHHFLAALGEFGGHDRR